MKVSVLKKMILRNENVSLDVIFSINYNKTLIFGIITMMVMVMVIWLLCMENNVKSSWQACCTVKVQESILLEFIAY